MNYSKLRLALIELVFVYIVIAFISPYKIMKSLIFIIIPMLIISIIVLNVKERLCKDKKKQEKLLNYCSEKIDKLIELMAILYKLNKNYRLSKVEHFLNRLNKCNEVEDYQILISLINHELLYISAVIEVWSKESYQNTKGNNTSEQKTSIRDKKIDAALLILELPSKTRDFVVIKSQYRSLMMKYHPDRNHDEEAKEIAISINAAYELLETVYN